MRPSNVHSFNVEGSNQIWIRRFECQLLQAMKLLIPEQLVYLPTLERILDMLNPQEQRLNLRFVNCNNTQNCTQHYILPSYSASWVYVHFYRTGELQQKQKRGQVKYLYIIVLNVLNIIKPIFGKYNDGNCSKCDKRECVKICKILTFKMY